ncbi:MAG TPA: sigma-70 family RNA polymerase sigma factor [Bacteroidales bacterium]|nr:sigma-70 family RNA polymerase sigma factor [Bacteroidales bacterium]
MIRKQDTDNNISYTHESSFSEVFKSHFDCLYNYGLRITGKKELTEDCIQEVFFRIWKNNIDLNTIAHVKSYLIKALRRQVLNVLELKINQSVSVDITENIGIDFSPEDFFILNQTEDNIRVKVVSLLNKLPEKQREAIYLRFFEELSFEDVATIMNINLQSAKNNVFRGLDSLKRMFPMISFLLY